MAFMYFELHIFENFDVFSDVVVVKWDDCIVNMYIYVVNTDDD